MELLKQLKYGAAFFVQTGDMITFRLISCMVISQFGSLIYILYIISKYPLDWKSTNFPI